MPIPTIREQILNTVQAALNPSHIDVVDDSHKHAGHSGSRPEGETHFRLLIVSEAFIGKSKVARQREVYRILEPLMKSHVHALQLFTYAPDEYPL